MPCAHVHLYILHEYMFLFLLTDKMLLSEGLHVPPTGSHPKLLVANNHIDAFYCTAINDKLVIFHLPVIYFGPEEE